MCWYDCSLTGCMTGPPRPVPARYQDLLAWAPGQTHPAMVGQMWGGFVRNRAASEANSGLQFRLGGCNLSAREADQLQHVPFLLARFVKHSCSTGVSSCLNECCRRHKCSCSIAAPTSALCSYRASPAAVADAQQTTLQKHSHDWRSPASACQSHKGVAVLEAPLRAHTLTPTKSPSCCQWFNNHVGHELRSSPQAKGHATSVAQKRARGRTPRAPRAGFLLQTLGPASEKILPRLVCGQVGNNIVAIARVWRRFKTHAFRNECTDACTWDAR